GGAIRGCDADPGIAVGCLAAARARVCLLHAIPLRDKHSGGCRARICRGRGNRLLYLDVLAATELSCRIDGAAGPGSDGDARGLHVIPAQSPPHIGSCAAKRKRPQGSWPWGRPFVLVLTTSEARSQPWPFPRPPSCCLSYKLPRHPSRETQPC